MYIAGKHHVLGLERKSLSYSDPEALWTKIKSLKQPYLATKESFTPQKRSKKTLLHQRANFPASRGLSRRETSASRERANHGDQKFKNHRKSVSVS